MTSPELDLCGGKVGPGGEGEIAAGLCSSIEDHLLECVGFDEF